MTKFLAGARASHDLPAGSVQPRLLATSTALAARACVGRDLLRERQRRFAQDGNGRADPSFATVLMRR
jgi:hypothetical protein